MLRLAKVRVLLRDTFAGAFGNVRVAWKKGNKETVWAIKTMKKRDIVESKHVDHIESEKEILS